MLQSLCNRRFWLSFCVVTLLFGFTVGVGTFVIGQNQISSFFSWHSDPWRVTVTSQLIRLSTNFMTFISSLTFTASGFHGAFATGFACQQRTRTLSDTWFRPFWELTYAPIVKKSFLDLALTFLDLSPSIHLDTVSFLDRTLNNSKFLNFFNLDSWLSWSLGLDMPSEVLFMFFISKKSIEP